MVFDPHIATLTLGGGDGGRGFLDLRGVVISNGVLAATDIVALIGRSVKLR
jgi:hypothetical protein